MRTTHTFGLQFIVRLDKKEQSTGSIYVRITIEAKRVEISLKKTIPIHLWNTAKGKAAGSSRESRILNNYLDDVRIKLTECYLELQLKQDRITPEAIKALFLGDHPDQHTLSELIDYHDLSQFPLLSVSTRKCYQIPDFILVDLVMPVMDGFEAVTYIRALHPEVPISALTAHSLPKDRRRALEVGCDEIITKPVNRDILLHILKKHLGRQNSANVLKN